MKASQCSFERMMVFASGFYELAEATSFLQVEYGLSELRACWDGFVHTSDAYGQTFKTKKQVYAEFASALTEYIDYLEKPTSYKVGR